MKQLNHDEIGYGEEHEEDKVEASGPWNAICACMKRIFTNP
jgi:hypothetical protein